MDFYIKFGISMIVGYLGASFIFPHLGWSTKKDSTNPWNITNIQRSMKSPPDRSINNPDYSPNPSHAPFPVLGPKFP